MKHQQQFTTAFFTIAVMIVCFIFVKYASIRDYPRGMWRITDGERSIVISPSLDAASLKTGDILAVSYRGARTIFSSLFCNSIWTHIGVVYIDNSGGATREPYVLKAATYRAPYVGAVNKIPLSKWTSINRNAAAVAVVPINKPADGEKLISTMREFEAADVGVQGLDPSWTRFRVRKTANTVPPSSLFAAPHRRYPPRLSAAYTRRGATYLAKKTYNRLVNGGDGTIPEDSYNYMITCIEFAAALLQNAGVFSNRYTPCSYLPSDFVNRKIETTNGFAYGAPYAVSLAAPPST